MRILRVFLPLTLSSLLLLIACAGGVERPDPKRTACNQSCASAAEKAAKSCKDEKKSADICDKAGEVAKNKCVDECMAH